MFRISGCWLLLFWLVQWLGILLVFGWINVVLNDTHLIILSSLSNKNADQVHMKMHELKLTGYSTGFDSKPDWNTVIKMKNNEEWMFSKTSSYDSQTRLNIPSCSSPLIKPQKTYVMTNQKYIFFEVSWQIVMNNGLKYTSSINIYIFPYDTQLWSILLTDPWYASMTWVPSACA